LAAIVRLRPPADAISLSLHSLEKFSRKPFEVAIGVGDSLCVAADDAIGRCGLKDEFPRFLHQGYQAAIVFQCCKTIWIFRRSEERQ
jgi:hypothetical protein